MSAGATVNPLAASELSGYNKSRGNTFAVSAVLEYKMPFLEGLSAKGTVSHGLNYNMSKALLRPYYLNVPFMPSEVGGDLTYSKYEDIRGNMNFLQEAASHYRDYTTNFSLNYNKKFKEHSIDAILLGEVTSSNDNSMSASGNGLDFYELDELNFLGQQEYYNIGGASGVRRKLDLWDVSAITSKVHIWPNYPLGTMDMICFRE